MSDRIEMIGEAGKLEPPKGGFKGAKIIEWRTGGASGMGELFTHIPYDTAEDIAKVDCLNKGDILELTSKEHGWTRQYKIQLFGIEHNQKVKHIYVVKI